MSDSTRLDLLVDPASVVVVGSGGAGRTRPAYADGRRLDGVNVRRAGADGVERDVYRLSGVAVSLHGVGLDGATVETLTPLDSIPTGAMFRAEGLAEIQIRGKVEPGSKNFPARGVLVLAVFLERLMPVAPVDSTVKERPASTSSAAK